MLLTRGVGKSFGGLRAVDDVTIELPAGSITAVIGPNGAGKSTLMNLISGFIAPDAGAILLGDASIAGLRPHQICKMGVARTFQNLQMFHDMPAQEVVVTGRQLHRSAPLFAELLMLPSARRAERAAAEEAGRLLDRMEVPAEFRDRRAGDLPYGLQRRVEIARALATEPAYLLLDEPAAGLNDDETAALGHTLRRLAGEGLGIALIEHDIELVMSVSDRVYVMDAGTVIANGTPAAVRNDPAVIRAYLGDAVEA